MRDMRRAQAVKLHDSGYLSEPNYLLEFRVPTRSSCGKHKLDRANGIRQRLITSLVNVADSSGTDKFE